MKISGAAAMVEALEREKVEVMFGIPGGATIPFFDELIKRKTIRNILVRHEQCAAHMADGYARVSGRVGVATATSGPGATNLVTGIAAAYMDSTPLVAITGQVPRNMIGRDAFQEADITGIVTPITKYTFLVMSASQIPSVIRTAFMLASTNRPGPVLVDIPRDVQLETTEVTFPDQVKLKGYTIRSGDPHPYQVKKAIGALINAERPIILAGGGVIMSGATNELIELAELLQAPIVTSLMGKGSVPETHPLCLGIVGMHGKAEANIALEEADVVLAVGTRISDRTVMRLDKFGENAKIIHIDIDPAEIGKNVRADIPIVADAKKALKAIKEGLVKMGFKRDPDTPWLKRIKELRDQFASEYEELLRGSLRPPKLMKILRQILPPDAIVTTGVGQNQMWSALYFEALQPRTFITSGGLGAMGFGFPAALGAKVAKPDKPVVDIDGDGSFLMTEQELATSICENIPIVVMIMDNRSLGMVRQWQSMMYEGRLSYVDLGRVPDFVKLAEAYGAEGVKVESYEEFESCMKRALRSEVTVVIDIPVPPDEKVFPMVLPGRRLKEVICRG